MSPVLALGVASTAFFGLVAVATATLSILLTRRPSVDGAPPSQGAVAALAVVAGLAAIVCVASLLGCVFYLQLVHHGSGD